MIAGAGKLVIFAILFTVGLQQLLRYEAWWFIQNVNLIFHEAGHVLFMIFGQFLFALGGTIVELGIPTLVLLLAIRQQRWFMAAGISWWCMSAWLSVSRYVSDAQERLLPLITRDPSTHDWHFLLTRLNLLPYDDVIGAICWGIALACLLFGWVLVLQDRQVRSLLHPIIRSNR